MTYIVPLGAAGLLALAACGSSSGATASSTSNVSPQVAAIKKTVAQMQDAQTTWTGPTTGPVASPGKRIVYLSGQESNSLDASYGQYLQQAAKKIGWTVTIIDGQGTPTGWLAGMDQAIALHPAGIIIFADATSLQQPIAVARADHIPVVGLHASQTTGPGYGLYANIQEDAAAIGRAEADYAIADSDGTAHVIIVTHNEYGIAVIKSDAMKSELAKCKGCKLLSYVNFPAADADTRMAQIATDWVSTYGESFYAMTVGDNDWDFAVPALSAGGASSGSIKLVGSDGTATAYQRIKAGDDFQVATVPEPAQEEADYAIYQMNRALHGLPADAWYPPIYLVTHSNVNAEGGDQDQFDPANNYEQIFTSLLTTGKS
jgi:ribose transport system substrate-binding protein